MSVRRACAVGAPSPRLDAVLPAGQARLGAPVGAPVADPERAATPSVQPTRTIQWHQHNRGAFVEYTPDPLHTFISNDEMNAYYAARHTFKKLIGYYERGSSGVYPLETKDLEIYSKSLFMSEDDRRILESRLAEIQGILATDYRPKRSVDDNSEYIEVLTKYVNHIGEIFKYQLSTDAKIWRRRVEGTW